MSKGLASSGKVLYLWDMRTILAASLSLIVGCGDLETRMVIGPVMLDGVATHLPQSVPPGSQVDMQIEPPDGSTLLSAMVYVSKDDSAKTAERSKAVHLLRQAIGHPAETITSASSVADGPGQVTIDVHADEDVSLSTHRYGIVFLQESGLGAATSTLYGATYTFLH